MRKEVVRTAGGLIVFGLITSLAACQSGGSSSKSAQMTDPNAVFAQGGAQANAANGTASGVPSRRGRGLFRTPPIYDLSLVDLTVGNDAAWGVDVLHGDLVGHWHHQVTFGRRNPIAAHDNNNLVMNAGERAG